jgi:hypothetical protein
MPRVPCFSRISPFFPFLACAGYAARAPDKVLVTQVLQKDVCNCVVGVGCEILEAFDLGFSKNDFTSVEFDVKAFFLGGPAEFPLDVDSEIEPYVRQVDFAANNVVQGEFSLVGRGDIRSRVFNLDGFGFREDFEDAVADRAAFNVKVAAVVGIHDGSKVGLGDLFVRGENVAAPVKNIEGEFFPQKQVGKQLDAGGFVVGVAHGWIPWFLEIQRQLPLVRRAAARRDRWRLQRGLGAGRHRVSGGLLFRSLGLALVGLLAFW